VTMNPSIANYWIYWFWINDWI